MTRSLVLGAGIVGRAAAWDLRIGEATKSPSPTPSGKRLVTSAKSSIAMEDG